MLILFVLLLKAQKLLQLLFSPVTYVYYRLTLLARILEEQALREYVLALFRLPRGERLHEVASCSVWTPHARCHTAGTLYTTDSYLCFCSREEGHCILLIPLSEVPEPENNQKLMVLSGGPINMLNANFPKSPEP